MKKILLLATSLFTLNAFATVTARLSQIDTLTDDLVLQNDSYNEAGSEAYLQMGFAQGEKAGVWVKVPSTIPYFKAKYFRVLISNGDQIAGQHTLDNTLYFQAGSAAKPSAQIPSTVQNAAQITPGPYWNDIPLQGDGGATVCAKGGEFVGAAIEFTNGGVPSIFRDGDGISNITYNVLMAIPGGWNYSASFGLTGDWVLRVVGAPATAAECGN